MSVLLAARPAAPVAESTAPPVLDVPASARRDLVAAIRSGFEDSLAFAQGRSSRDRWQVGEWALLKMAWPPKDDAAELEVLHGIARGRTPAGIEAARYWSSHGLTERWEQLVEEWAASVGPAEARRGRRLLQDALMATNHATQVAKAAAARRRPFDVDPTLPLAVDRPGNNPSYPSGHTSAAVAAYVVLAHLMPHRREELFGLALQATWARIYAGVHFPSDVVAGARLAATIASHLASTSGAGASARAR